MSTSPDATDASPAEVKANASHHDTQLRHIHWARLIAGAVVGTTCSVMYQLLQHFPARAAQLRTDCWSWQMMPFSELWLWPYLSMFVIVGCAWLALPDKRSIKRFIACCLGTASIAWVCFYLWPTSCLRPSPELRSIPYRMLVFLDAPSNCLPCLHSAFTILAAVALHRWISRTQYRSALRLLLIIWVILINLSIIGLRQHTGIDITAGLLLGGCAGWIYSLGNADCHQAL